ncbi:MAG: hypothetical protein K2O91_17165 [Lachnospiraceae bacterium]|nr:hypothetical protein [Lachnospiraceae bacterium]
MSGKNNGVKKTYEELEEYIRELEKQLKGNRNREYKSRLFSFLFGREENKHWTLSLYNAIHGTSHDDLSSITINTIEDVVYMGMKNDLSILVSETVSLYSSLEIYEQQSSYNPNMPVREFMYAGKLYDKFIHSAKLNRYGKSLLPLPLPKLVVFYNGENEKEDEVILRLSDAFKEEIRQNITNRNAENNKVVDDSELSAEVERIFQEASPDIEVKVRMININHGHNKEILAACKPLGEYAWFIEQVRKNHSANKTGNDNIPMEIGTAIDQAIDEMPEDFEIKKFITKNRAEVKDMCLTEYNETETMEMLRQEGRQEGLQIGIQKATLLHIKNLMDSTEWTADQIMEMLKIPPNQRAALYANLSKNS